MSLSTPSVLPEQWRYLLRAILRECSCLPDPVAKSYMHVSVIERFRRYNSTPKIQHHIRNDLNRQHQLRKAAKQKLTLLRRANEGYTKPLEQVLRLSYGRTGKRRKVLLDEFITPEVPTGSQEVQDLINKPFKFDDGWEPPSLVMGLLKSQRQNGAIAELSVRQPVKKLEPPIPEENSWGRPLCRTRRRNIRKDWYSAVLNSLYPPLPEADVNILRGLISGTIPWVPPKRRTKVGTVSCEPTAALDKKFLVEGPSKGQTHRQFVNGRPHQITRRFMRRLWQRIICLVPQMSRNDISQKWSFGWEPAKLPPKLALPVSIEQQSNIFGSVNLEGKVIPPSTEKPKKQHELDAGHRVEH